jgi:hypothetical protein
MAEYYGALPFAYLRKLQKIYAGDLAAFGYDWPGF